MNRDEVITTQEDQFKGRWDEIPPCAAYPPNFETVQRYLDGVRFIQEQDVQKIVGPTVEQGRFGDLDLLPIGVVSFNDFCGYETKPLWPRGSRDAEPGDVSMHKFGAFIAEFLFRMERSLASKTNRMEDVLKKIVVEAFSERGCVQEAAEQRFQACGLSYTFVLSSFIYWGQLAEKLQETFPATKAVFVDVVMPRMRTIFEVQQTTFKNNLITQSEHLRLSVYQAGVTQLSQQTVMVVATLLTTQLQIDYNVFRAARHGLLGSQAATINAFLEQCDIDPEDIEYFFKPEVDSYTFLALHTFERSTIEMVRILLTNADTQLDRIVDSQKEEVKTKYGQLARLTHANFTLWYFRRFLEQYLQEYERHLCLLTEQIIVQYAEEQLRYQLPWYRFVVEVQKMLETWDMSRVQQDARWNHAAFQVVLTDLNAAGRAAYKAIFVRIMKQMGVPLVHSVGIPLLIVKQAQAILRSSLMAQMLQNVQAKYRRFATFKDVDYGITAKLIDLEAVQQCIRDAFRE